MGEKGVERGLWRRRGSGSERGIGLTCWEEVVVVELNELTELRVKGVGSRY